VNQDGQIEPISGQDGKERRIAYPNVSPDGARVVCSVTHDDDIDVWIFRLDDGAPTRLTFGDGDYLWPRWMPGGEVIVATRRSEEGDATVFLSADGGGEVRDAIAGLQFGIGPDGASIVVMRFGEETGREFWLVPLNEPDAATLILKSIGVVMNMAFSPDGAWLAYEVDEGSDREAIYLTRFPSEQGRWQVAEGGAREPIWTSDGAQLFFRGANDRIMAVDVTTEPTLSLGQPRQVLQLWKQGLMSSSGFGVTPDGRRLLVTQAAGSDNTRPTIAVVENWIEEFREREGQ
jgi:Tol biopolymer transport system component